MPHVFAAVASFVAGSLFSAGVGAGVAAAVGNAIIAVGSFAVGSGAWSLSIPIPNDASLTGSTVATQAVLAPGSGAHAFDLTNRVDLTFGR